MYGGISPLIEQFLITLHKSLKKVCWDLSIAYISLRVTYITIDNIIADKKKIKNLKHNIVTSSITLLDKYNSRCIYGFYYSM